MVWPRRSVSICCAPLTYFCQCTSACLKRACHSRAWASIKDGVKMEDWLLRKLKQTKNQKVLSHQLTTSCRALSSSELLMKKGVFTSKKKKLFIFLFLALIIHNTLFLIIAVLSTMFSFQIKDSIQIVTIHLSLLWEMHNRACTNVQIGHVQMYNLTKGKSSVINYKITI